MRLSVLPEWRCPPVWCGLLGVALSGLALAACTVSFGNTGGDCGNGVVEGSETCDDGNASASDGCSSACQLEDGWTCDGEPSLCTPVCGDGQALGTETCDGSDLRNLDCVQLGLGGGNLACGADCRLDTSGCDLQSVCGNGSVEYPETCDGTNFNGATCDDFGFNAGELHCTASCEIDIWGCEYQTVCGDDVAEGLEDCDNADLRGMTCAGLNLGGGDLACTSQCTYDTSDCELSPSCGNGTIEFPEACDGNNLSGQTCASQGYYGGTLSCQSDCSGFDDSQCSGTCGDGSVNGPEACDGNNLDGQSCQSLGYLTGTLGCTPSCLSFDTSSCQGLCGDGNQEFPEECDGTDLGGEDCVSLGFYGGPLTCSSSCTLVSSACHTAPRVVINELDAGLPDTVELLNLSAVTVDLLNYSVDAHGMNLSGNPTVYVMDLPQYFLAPGDYVTLIDSNTPNGNPPDVNLAAKTIQYHDNINWGGGTFYGAAALYDDNGSPLDFVRWPDNTVSVPAGATWSDGPAYLMAISGNNTTLSRVPDGVDTDTPADWCVAPRSQSQANQPCLDPSSGSTVIITEVDPGEPDAVELYNAGPNAVDLEGWTVFWRGTNPGAYGGDTLPSYVLNVGDYVEIRDSAGNNQPYVAGGYIAVRNMDLQPDNPGAVGLVDPTLVGRDFVRWGGHSQSPWHPDTFSDTPGPVPEPLLGSSLGRDVLSDTDIAGDWCVMTPSLGGPNAPCN